jgi:hypothetical protein
VNDDAAAWWRLLPKQGSTRPRGPARHGKYQRRDPDRRPGEGGQLARARSSSGTDSMAAAVPDDPYANYSALIDSVESGAVAPLRGSWLLSLYERKGRIVRRQDLPPEAFWTAAELRAIVERAKAHFGDDESAGLAAVGRLFTALSYRWLAKGEPDPDGFHLERVANFLYSYLGRGNPKFDDWKEEFVSTYLGLTPLNKDLFAPLDQSDAIDCAVFWDFGVLWQKKLLDAETGTQEDDRTTEQKAQFDAGLKASNVW